VAPLVDLDTYKLAIGETDAANDAKHQLFLDASIQAVLNFTDRDFATDLVLETRTYEAPDLGFIVDIDGATEVVDVDDIGGAEWRTGSEGPAASQGVITYIEIAAFRPASALMGFTRNEDRLGTGFSPSVDVTANWGWPEVPADVVQAVIWTAEDLEGESGNATGGLAAKSVAEVAENYLQQSVVRNFDDNEPLSPRSRTLLLPYRRISL